MSPALDSVQVIVVFRAFYGKEIVLVGTGSSYEMTQSVTKRLHETGKRSEWRERGPWVRA